MTTRQPRPGTERRSAGPATHPLGGTLAGCDLITKGKKPHMRLKAVTGAALLTIALPLAACGASTHDAQSGSPSSQSTSQGSSTARAGTFQGLNGKHVAGTAKVTDGQIVLSGFLSDEGPDLHIYLTNGTDESAVTAGKELSNVAFDRASQNFSITGVDASKYTTVVIHCDKARAVFGAAKLW